MSSSPAQLRALRAELRAKAGQFLQRFYRHDVLMARAVRGIELEAVQRFRSQVAEPLIEKVGGRLAGFDARGNDVTPESNRQLASIIRESEAIIERGVVSVQKLTDRRLQDVGKQEAGFVTATVDQTADMRTKAPPAREVARASGMPYLGDSPERWFGKLLTGPTADGVRQRIAQGIQRGDTVDQIVRSIRGTRTQAGILDASTGAVQALVRTSATSASAQARMVAFAQLGVTHWYFTATLDTRTTIVCGSNDGKRFAVGEGPIPPLHPNCRSVAVPDVGTIDGTRASIDGQVDASTTFEEWLGTRTDEEQNEVLGVAKANAWRAGTVTLQDLLGRDLQPLTLAELRALDRIS